MWMASEPQLVTTAPAKAGYADMTLGWSGLDSFDTSVTLSDHV